MKAVKKAARELKDIVLGEVSLVDKAANNLKFLFFKAAEDATDKKSTSSKKLKKKINIVIDSDGTIGGTKISLNEEEIENLRDFNFSFWSNDDDSRAVSCSYSKVVETDDGFSRSETFYLAKGESEMNKDVEKLLKEYFGEDSEVDFEKAAEDTDLVEALGTINEYKKEFPDDLQSAIGVIAKQAGLYTPEKKVEKKDDDTEDNDDDDKKKLKKSGAKLSKDTLKKLTDAVAALKSILPAITEKTEKSDKSEVAKTLEEITKSIERLEKGKEDASKDEITKLLAKLAKRLETVEKGTGISKRIEDQDNDDDDNKDTKWPSFQN